MEILLLSTLIVLNGLFAMSEIALVTARCARLAKLAEEGDASAAVAVRLHDKILATPIPVADAPSPDAPAGPA